MRRRGLKWLTTVVVVMTSGAGLASCGGPPARTESSFCGTLKSGTAKLKSNVTSASSSFTGQLGAAVANLGEFTRLIHQLDARAPAEIKTDMDQATQYWDSQKQSLSQAASDPLGGIASSLVSGIFASASLQAVDNYASSHCGTSLFGTNVSLSGTGSDSGNTPDPGTSSTSASGCPATAEPVDLLDSSTTFDALTSQLKTEEGSSDSSLAAAAKAIDDAVGALSPSPSTSVEALGRLAFSQQDPVSLLNSLKSAESNACGTSSLANETVDSTTFTPTPVGDGVRIGDVYGQCSGQQSTATGWLAPFTEQIACGEDADSVDLTTGVVTNASGVPASQAQPFGGGWAWVTVDTTAAEGLTQESYTASLHLAKSDGTSIAVIQFIPATPSNNPPDPGGLLNVLGNYLTVHDQGDQNNNVDPAYTAFDASGKKIWSQRLGSLYQVTADTAIGDNPEASDGSSTSRLIDLRTGQTLATINGNAQGASSTGSCGRDGIVDITSPRSLVTETAAGVVSLSQINDNVVPDSSNDVIVDGVIVGDVSSDSAWEGLRPDGTKLWSIPESIATRVDGLGRWVVVTNTADQQVIVDPLTGKDVTSDEAVIAKLASGGALGNDATITPSTSSGPVIVTGTDPSSNDTIAWQVPYSTLCT